MGLWVAETPTSSLPVWIHEGYLSGDGHRCRVGGEREHLRDSPISGLQMGLWSGWAEQGLL